MTVSRTPNTGTLHALAESAKRHRLLLAILVVLSLIAGSSSMFLKADLLGGDPSSSEDGIEWPSGGPHTATCTSVGTMFQDIKNVDRAVELLTGQMSLIVSEREQYLSSPSSWSCSGPPPVPRLITLASALPGLQVIINGQPAWRTVSFETFSSVAGELLREFDCTLVELSADRQQAVITNEDLRQPAVFCCASDQCIGVLDDPSVCDAGSVTADPQCDDQCQVVTTDQDLAVRPEFLEQRITFERGRARTAYEHTLMALRSYELAHPVLQPLLCYLRASNNLKNELGLLADAISCMPRVWDSLTSLHDRSPVQP
jgi:hypothetical protein